MTDAPNPYAWPADWRADAGYRRTYKALLFNYGPEHANRVVLGLDQDASRDLWLWRNLGMPKPLRGSTP